MGMFDHITAKCPTPNCLGELYGQTKAGDCSLNSFVVEWQMTAIEAAAVDGEILHCEACGASATIEAEEAPKVKVKLTNVQIGDVELTILVQRYMISSIDEEDLKTFSSYLSWRFAKTGEITFPKTKEEYLAIQAIGFPNSTEPKDFTCTKDGRRFQGRIWCSFKERDKSGAV